MLLIQTIGILLSRLAIISKLKALGVSVISAIRHILTGFALISLALSVVPANAWAEAPSVMPAVFPSPFTGSTPTSEMYTDLGVCTDKSLLSISEIVSALAIAGLPGLVIAAIPVAFLTLISVFVIEGTQIACPPGDPNYPDRPTYWNSPDTKNKIFVSYAPCTWFPVAVTAEEKVELNESGSLKYPSGYKCPVERWSADTFALTLNADGSGTENWSHAIPFGVKKDGDKICLVVNWAIEFRLGCQVLPPSPPLPPVRLPCFMPQVCSDRAAVSESQYLFSITGNVVQCIEGAVNAILIDSRVSGADRNCPVTSLSQNFQNVMQNTVTAALILYIMFWGMKISFGQGSFIDSRGEIFKKLMVFILVGYFAVGDGWVAYLPMLKTIGNELATTVLSSSTQNYCNFPANGLQYSDNYKTMQLWDTLDCKFLSYIFSDQNYPKALAVGGYAFLGGGILILVFVLLFMIFLLNIMFIVVGTYFESVIAIALLVFLSPLFVPAALFPQTKKYFDGWLSAIFGYILYPVILFAFVALMLNSFDALYYGDSTSSGKNKWVSSESTASNNPNCLAPGDPRKGTQRETSICSNIGPRFQEKCMIDDRLYNTHRECMSGCEGGVCFPVCDETTFGCQLYRVQFRKDDNSLGGVPMVTLDETFRMDYALLSLLKVAGVGMLFFFFMSILGPVVAELTGSHKTDLSSNSSAKFNNVVGGVVAKIQKAVSGKG